MTKRQILSNPNALYELMVEAHQQGLLKISYPDMGEGETHKEVLPEKVILHNGRLADPINGKFEVVLQVMP